MWQDVDILRFRIFSLSGKIALGVMYDMYGRGYIYNIKGELSFVPTRTGTRKA